MHNMCQNLDPPLMQKYMGDMAINSGLTKAEHRQISPIHQWRNLPCLGGFFQDWSGEPSCWWWISCTKTRKSVPSFTMNYIQILNSSFRTNCGRLHILQCETNMTAGHTYDLWNLVDKLYQTNVGSVDKPIPHFPSWVHRLMGNMISSNICEILNS